MVQPKPIMSLVASPIQRRLPFRQQRLKCTMRNRRPSNLLCPSNLPPKKFWNFPAHEGLLIPKYTLQNKASLTPRRLSHSEIFPNPHPCSLSLPNLVDLTFTTIQWVAMNMKTRYQRHHRSHSFVTRPASVRFHDPFTYLKTETVFAGGGGCSVWVAIATSTSSSGSCSQQSTTISFLFLFLLSTFPFWPLLRQHLLLISP